MLAILFAGERIVAIVVEEEGDVRVLLGFGTAELMQALAELTNWPRISCIFAELGQR